METINYEQITYKVIFCIKNKQINDKIKDYNQNLLGLV